MDTSGRADRGCSVYSERDALLDSPSLSWKQPTGRAQTERDPHPLIIAALTEQDGLYEVCSELQPADCLLTELVSLHWVFFSSVKSPSYSVVSVEIPEGWCRAINAGLLQFHYMTVQRHYCEGSLCLAEKRSSVGDKLTVNIRKGSWRIYRIWSIDCTVHFLFSFLLSKDSVSHSLRLK